MISIIIPVYNSEKHIVECMQSVTNQTFKVFEVICVNDGSTDNTEGLIKRHLEKDSRFRLISQANKGVSNARNNGLKASKGNYICFIDSDDIIDKDYLNHLYMNNSKFDLVVCDFTFSEKKLGHKNDYRVKYSPNKMIQNIINQTVKHPQIACMIFKSHILKENHVFFEENCFRNEDTEFYLKYMSCCKRSFLSIGYIGYYYRQHDGSVMHNLTLKSLTSLDASIRINDLLVSKGIVSSDNFIISRGVLKFVFLSAITNNTDIYNYLHDKYNVDYCMKKMINFPILKSKLVAYLYTLFGRIVFYKILSKKSMKALIYK